MLQHCLDSEQTVILICTLYISGLHVVKFMLIFIVSCIYDSTGKLSVQKITGVLALWTLPRVSKSLCVALLKKAAAVKEHAWHMRSGRMPWTGGCTKSGYEGVEERRKKLEVLGQVAVGLFMSTDCGGCQS